jgi:hypothetical protein
VTVQVRLDAAPCLGRGTLVQVPLDDSPQGVDNRAMYPGARLDSPKLNPFMSALEAKLRADERLR